MRSKSSATSVYRKQGINGITESRRNSAKIRQNIFLIHKRFAVVLMLQLYTKLIFFILKKKNKTETKVRSNKIKQKILSMGDHPTERI